MQKSLLFYIAGGLLGLFLLIYVIYLVNFLVSRISVVSGTNLLQTPQITTYNFDKFRQIKGAPQQ